MYNDVPKKQVCLTAIILAISVMGDSMLYGVLPSHLGEFGLTAGFGAGLILSANRWIRLISNTWAARIFTRFGLRKPFYFSVVLAITSTAAYGLFQGFWPLLLSRIAWGICFSIQLVSLYMIVLRENEQYRGRLMGLYNAIFRSGSLMAVLVGGLLVDLIGIKVSFLIMSSIMIICFPIISLIYESDSYLNLENKQPERSNLRRNGNYPTTLWSLLTGSQGGDAVPDLEIPRYIRLMEIGKMRLDGLITHEFELNEINDALDLFRAGKAGRIIIRMQ